MEQLHSISFEQISVAVTFLSRAEESFPPAAPGPALGSPSRSLATAESVGLTWL